MVSRMLSGISPPGAIDRRPGGLDFPAGGVIGGSPPRFLLPVQVLSQLFRRLFLEKLVAAHRAGKLQFFGKHAPLSDRHVAPAR
jgi:hypothetical protein